MKIISKIHTEQKNSGKQKENNQLDEKQQKNIKINYIEIHINDIEK